MTVLALTLAASGADPLVQAVGPETFPTAVYLVLALALFLGLRAFFAGSETALVSLDPVLVRRLAAEGSERARIIRRLIDDPDRMLAMTLAGTNLMSVIIAQTGLALVLVLLPGAPGAPMVATVMTTVLVLMFGEILPKTIFRARAGALAIRYAYLLRIFDVALGFVVRGVTAVTSLLVSVVGERMGPTSNNSVRSELRLLATLGERSGAIPREHRRMIHGVLSLSERRVEHVMVPLIDMIAVERRADLESFLDIAAMSGFSRIPVYEDRVYNIIGIVHILDVIHAASDDDGLEPFIRSEIGFVPESKPIHALLKEIQGGPHTMVFGVDERGGVTGLVTVEDLVEEVFGELADERVEPENVRFVGPRVIECAGRTEIDVLVEDLGVPIPEGDYETIAGFVLERMGRIPAAGERVETDDFVVTVSEADERAIHSVRIRNKTGSFTPEDRT